MNKRQYLKENGWCCHYNDDCWYSKISYPGEYDNEFKYIPPPQNEGITLEEAYIKSKQR